MALIPSKFIISYPFKQTEYFLYYYIGLAHRCTDWICHLTADEYTHTIYKENLV